MGTVCGVIARQCRQSAQPLAVTKPSTTDARSEWSEEVDEAVGS
jgi:hypothetical protein